MTALPPFDPPIHRPLLPETDVSYAVCDTAVGRLLLAVTADGVLVASRYAATPAAEDAILTRLAARVSPRILAHRRPLDEAQHQLDAYLSGKRRRFDVRTDLVLASPFQRTVLAALEHTPYGRTTTYGTLADTIGKTGAARAIGSALGANPLCVVVPCHRVLTATGGIGGYAGGIAAKERLLALEALTGPER